MGFIHTFKNRRPSWGMFTDNHEGESGNDVPDGPDAFDVDAFLAAARERHRAFWAIPPPPLPEIINPCKRCEGTGRAPRPSGHVGCSACRGSRKEPAKWKG